MLVAPVSFLQWVPAQAAGVFIGVQSCPETATFGVLLLSFA